MMLGTRQLLRTAAISDLKRALQKRSIALGTNFDIDKRGDSLPDGPWLWLSFIAWCKAPSTSRTKASLIASVAPKMAKSQSERTSAALLPGGVNGRVTQVAPARLL